MGISLSLLLTLQRERLADAWPDMQPLLARHFAELMPEAADHIAPNRALYDRMESVGALYLYTMRTSDGALVGYVAFCVGPDTHRVHRLCASQIVLYLAPQYRRGMQGVRLIRYADQQLAAAGVDAVTHYVKPARDYSAILRRLGYREKSTSYIRELRKR